MWPKTTLLLLCALLLLPSVAATVVVDQTEVEKERTASWRRTLEPGTEEYNNSDIRPSRGRRTLDDNALLQSLQQEDKDQRLRQIQETLTTTEESSSSSIRNNRNDNNDKQNGRRRSLQQDFRASIELRMTRFEVAKERFLNRLSQEYGPENFDKLWMDDQPAFPLPNNETRCTIGRNVFLRGTPNANLSWHKTVRKMKLNILQSVIQGKPQDFVWATAYVVVVGKCLPCVCAILSNFWSHTCLTSYFFLVFVSTRVR